jgi:hypothetical protein
MFLSFACPKERNKRKRQPQIFFGLNILSDAHALQLAFATSKMLIYFQKRFGGITCLTAI